MNVFQAVSTAVIVYSTFGNTGGHGCVSQTLLDTTDITLRCPSGVGIVVWQFILSTMYNNYRLVILRRLCLLQGYVRDDPELNKG